MATEVKSLGSVSFSDALGWVLFKFDTLNITDVTFDGVWVKGNIEAKYTAFNSDKDDHFGFAVEINQTTEVDYGILKIPVHVWLDGPKLWIGCGVDIPDFRIHIDQDTFKTSIDLPQ